MHTAHDAEGTMRDNLAAPLIIAVGLGWLLVSLAAAFAIPLATFTGQPLRWDCGGSLEEA